MGSRPCDRQSGVASLDGLCCGRSRPAFHILPRAPPASSVGPIEIIRVWILLIERLVGHPPQSIPRPRSQADQAIMRTLGRFWPARRCMHFDLFGPTKWRGWPHEAGSNPHRLEVGWRFNHMLLRSLMDLCRLLLPQHRSPCIPRCCTASLTYLAARFWLTESGKGRASLREARGRVRRAQGHWIG